MNKEVIEIQVRAVVPLDGSYAVFLGNSGKTFVIYVDEPVGHAISMFMRGVTKERPLTHDLLASVLMAFGAKVDRVVINSVSGSVFRARLILIAENELHTKKVVEIDARPSDSIAMAVKSGSPIFVARAVLDSVEDMTEALEEVEKRGKNATEVDSNEEGISSEDEDDDDEEEEDDDLFEDDDDDFNFEDDDDSEEEKDDDDEGENDEPRRIR